MSVYSQLIADRPEPAPRSLKGLVAFGDPLLDSSPPGGPPPAGSDLSPILRRIGPRAPLPYSRRELEGIAKLIPEGAGTFFLSGDASEAQLKKLSKDTRFLHLSTHAVTDEDFPMRSAIILSEYQKSPTAFLSEEENGLFQVGEIFEGFRLDAELVVLSGCETGLGQELRGEGLIGLTRAFHVAGARSVIASLWQVADESTSELMIRFYKNLKDGLPKDEALRAAQISLIREPVTTPDAQGNLVLKDFSAPFHWAAFQLYGDWQ